MSNKYNCHDLSELAQRYGGELRPVLAIAPSINGEVPLPAVLGATAESDIAPEDPCSSDAVVNYTREMLQCFRVRSVMGHMRVDGLDMSRLTMDGASQYRVPLESMYYTHEEVVEEAAPIEEIDTSGVADIEADDPVCMMDDSPPRAVPTQRTAVATDNCLDSSSMLISLDVLVQHADQVEAVRRAVGHNDMRAPDRDANLPLPKKRKQSSGGSRELSGLMHDVKVTKAWDKPVVEGQDELNGHLHQMLQELKGSQCSSFAWPFLTKVKKVEAPDYYDLIRNPMDLSMMEKKLKKCEYFSKTQFEKDVALMVSNCRTYNINADSIYRTHASQLERFAHDMLLKCPDLELGPGGAVIPARRRVEEVQNVRSAVSSLVTATRSQAEEKKCLLATSNLRRHLQSQREANELLEFGDRPAIERHSEVMGEFLGEGQSLLPPSSLRLQSSVPRPYSIALQPLSALISQLISDMIGAACISITLLIHLRIDRDCAAVAESQPPKWPELSHPASCVPTTWRLPEPMMQSPDWLMQAGSKHVSANPAARCALHRGMATLIAAEGFTSVQAAALPILADVLTARIRTALVALQAKLPPTALVCTDCTKSQGKQESAQGVLDASCVLRTLDQAGLPASEAMQKLLGTKERGGRASARGAGSIKWTTDGQEEVIGSGNAASFPSKKGRH